MTVFLIEVTSLMIFTRIIISNKENGSEILKTKFLMKYFVTVSNCDFGQGNDLNLISKFKLNKKILHY